MKCYYCETEFSSNVCPKCHAVYTITEDEAKVKQEKVIAKDSSEEDKTKSGKAGKAEIILDVVDALVDIVDSIF